MLSWARIENQAHAIEEFLLCNAAIIELAFILVGTDRMSAASENVQMPVLGYDARSISAAWRSLWNEDRRQRFLIKQDVCCPLSVDTLVWPSLFDWGQGPGLSLRERRRMLLSGGLTAARRSYARWPLWSDLSGMMKELDDPIDPTFLPFWIIAVASVDCDESNYTNQMEFFGYDVADESFLSGISNCGYGNEIDQLRADWAAELNGFHLFPNRDAADRFRRLTDTRVPEHRPFGVYGIWVAK